MNVGKPEVAGSTPASSILSARVTQWSECGSYERSFWLPIDHNHADNLQLRLL
jgi:hypothetical protein